MRTGSKKDRAFFGKSDKKHSLFRCYDNQNAFPARISL